MDALTVAQIASFVVVLGAGYHFLFKVNREMRAQRTAVGCPQVIVENDYGRLPEVGLCRHDHY